VTTKDSEHPGSLILKPNVKKAEDLEMMRLAVVGEAAAKEKVVGK
jgi:hypothetical protein